MKKPTKCDKRLLAVSAALESVEAPGDYCKMGSYPLYPPPGLVVDGVGDVALPLTDAAAKAVIAASHLAPFGHGEQTLVDTEVRNTWELSANEFRLENAAFTTFIKDQVAEACRVPLGIHESVVFEAKRYKLLLYEAGGKFERHQDSEKESGMFGTLVVVLPGRFEGGELLVHPPSKSGEAGDVHVFDAAAMDAFSLKYAAFYGDCPHEVKPVTSGFRLCVTFNLVKIARPGGVALPQYGSNHALFARLKNALDKYFCKDGAEKTKRRRIDMNGSSASVGFDVLNPEMYRKTKLVYVLAHKYTDANLSFFNLKGRDAAVAASLASYCGAGDGAMGLYLCKMQYRFSWRGEPGTMYESDEDLDGCTGEQSEDSGDEESEVLSGKATEGSAGVQGDGSHKETEAPHDLQTEGSACQETEGSGDDELEGAGDEKAEGSGDDKSGGSEGSVDDEEDDDGANGEILRSLDLIRPWVQYNEHEKVMVDASRKMKTFSECDLTADVVPCGIFEKKGIKYDNQNSSEYTGNEGASSERWYGSAALVAAPLRVYAEWTLATKGRSALLETWFQLADSKPAHARAIALAFGPSVFKWSPTSDIGKRILESLAKIDDVDAVCAVLSAVELVEFEPQLHRVMARFGSDSLVKVATEVAGQSRRGYGARSLVNFVASILDGVTSAATIAAVLDAADPEPYVGSTDHENEADDVKLEDTDTQPAEFARVLKLASLVSIDRVLAMLDKCEVAELVLVAAPAAQQLLAHDGAVAVAIIDHLIDSLKKELPALRNESYDCTIQCVSNNYYGSFYAPFARNCANCDALSAFLKSPEETSVVEKAVFDSHLKEKLEQAKVLGRLAVEPSDDSKVVLTKTYESQLFKKAKAVMMGLGEVVAEYVRATVVNGATHVE